jgi:hypothetical protein
MSYPYDKLSSALYELGKNNSTTYTLYSTWIYEGGYPGGTKVCRALTQAAGIEWVREQLGTWSNALTLSDIAAGLLIISHLTGHSYNWCYPELTRDGVIIYTGNADAVLTWIMAELNNPNNPLPDGTGTTNDDAKGIVHLSDVNWEIYDAWVLANANGPSDV